jgi:hypothetical protein
MKQPTQPELIPPERKTTTISVNGCDMERAERELLTASAVILSANVRGASYTLTLILPPGKMFEANEHQPSAA